MLVDWQDAWGLISWQGGQAVTSASESEGGADEEITGRGIRWDRRRRAIATQRYLGRV